MTQPEQTVPMLRFSEFEDQWIKGKIQDFDIQIIDGDRGANYPSSSDFSNEGFCLFLNAKNVTKEGFRFDEVAFISREKDESMSKGKLNRHDIVLTTRGSIGHIASYDSNVRNDNIRINSGMVIVRCQERVDPNYAYSLFRSPKFQRQVQRVSFGSAQPQLTVSGIKALPFVAPPNYEEQQKIAAFLGAVDEKIAQLHKKKDLLEDYKKGCMQKLFSQTLRFKDDNGNPFPDWEETTLGKQSQVKTGDSNREDSTEEGDYVFFDRSNDVRASSKYLFDCEAIIVAGEGKDFLPKYFQGKFDLHQRAYAIINFSNNNGKFLFYWIHKHRDHFLKYAVGSTMPSLRRNAFENFPVNLPYPDEQKKIADFLSAIDDKITLVSAELDKAKTFKKGLLQKMFV